MKNPVRIIVKNVKTDAHGQQIDAGYKTVDIDNKELESLLFETQPHLYGQYQVVGAELLNKKELLEEHEKDSLNF